MWRIGEAAQRAGVSERTLRYYEEIGLVAPAAHSPGGNRRYGEAEIARVLRIRELQELMGFNLDEIREVLSTEDRLEALRSRWRASADPGDRREILEEGIAATLPLRARVDAKRSRLTGFLDELDAKLARYHELLDELGASVAPSSGQQPRT